jgi:hypothetical protein
VTARNAALAALCLFVAQAAASAPWAEPGTSCEKFLARERKHGAKVLRREAFDADSFRVELDTTVRQQPARGSVSCKHGAITGSLVAFRFANEKNAVHVLHLLRADLETRLGKPAVDGTDPEQVADYQRRAATVGIEGAEEIVRDYVAWSNAGVDHTLTLHPMEGAWVVSLFADVAPVP